MLFGVGAGDAVDPLEPFQSITERDIQTKNIIRAVLLKDKELQRQKYIQALGIKPKKSKNFKFNKDPINRLMAEDDPICAKAMKMIQILKELRINYVKIKNNDTISEDEQEDMKDRIKIAIRKIKAKLKDFEAKIEVEFDN